MTPRGANEQQPYRVVGRYADDVTPPRIAGDVAMCGYYDTREDADIGIEELAGRTDIGLIALAVQSFGKLVDLHTWTRTPDGWRHC